MMTWRDFLRWLDEYFMTYVVPGFSLGIVAAILVGTVVGVEGSYGRFLWVVVGACGGIIIGCHLANGRKAPCDGPTQGGG